MKRRIVIFVVFVCALAALSVFAREYATLDAFVEQEARVRAALERQPWPGFVVGFVIYVIVSLVPGTTGKALVVGWLWGFWAGLLIVNVGLTAAALLSFLISRYACHDLIARVWGPRLVRVNAALRRDGASYLFAARVLHAPFSITNYVLGATKIRVSSFWWATQLGILPGNILFVYAGTQVPTIAQLREDGLGSLLSPGILVAFVAVSVLPLAIRWGVKRLLAARPGRVRELAPAAGGLP